MSSFDACVDPIEIGSAGGVDVDHEHRRHFV
jgi:hypothetical protein